MKANIIGEFVRYDLAHETKLRIYENKNGLRGTLLDSYGRKIDSSMFYGKDIDNTICRVMEYFGYTEDNYYRIS